VSTTVAAGRLAWRPIARFAIAGRFVVVVVVVPL
jgi:hypothetical protein